MTIGNINTPVLTRATRVFLSHISAVASARHASDGDGAVLLDAVGDVAEEGADLVLGAVGAHGLLVDFGALGVEAGRGVAADPEAGGVASLGELLALGDLCLRRSDFAWVTDAARMHAARLTVGDEVGVVVLAYLAREACNEAGSSDFCHNRPPRIPLLRGKIIPRGGMRGKSDPLKSPLLRGKICPVRRMRGKWFVNKRRPLPTSRWEAFALADKMRANILLCWAWATTFVTFLHLPSGRL